MQIKNRTINIFGTKYKLKFVDKIFTEDDSLFATGRVTPTSGLIEIATKRCDGTPMPIEEMRVALLHELFHAICDIGQYRDEYSNEPLI